MSKSGKNYRMQIHKRAGSDGGISYQLPPNWTDGSGKIRHVKEGPNKGRVFFSSRYEAKEIAKRLQDSEQRFVRYDD